MCVCVSLPSRTLVFDISQFVPPFTMTILLVGSMTLFEVVRQFPPHLGDRVMVANLAMISFDRFCIIFGMVLMGKNDISHNTTHMATLIETLGEPLLVLYCYVENVLSTFYTL